MEKYLNMVYLLEGANEALKRSKEIIKDQELNPLLSSEGTNGGTACHCEKRKLSDGPTSVHKRFQKPSTSAKIRVVANEKQAGKTKTEKSLMRWREKGLVLEIKSTPHSPLNIGFLWEREKVKRVGRTIRFYAFRGVLLMDCL
uniref:Uncharacterized protein n=1 Tax=Megaselia scalaris TaxID=36166 RepID=T1GK13_MEGSC